MPPSPLLSRFLGILTIDIGTSYALGDTPAGARRIDLFAGGTLIGPRITARIEPGGVDVNLRRHDGAMQPDARLVLRTQDDALVFMTYRGIRHGSPADMMARLARGEAVDPSLYYLRNAPFFETADARYAWLNQIITVGIGRRVAAQVIYDLHEVL